MLTADRVIPCNSRWLAIEAVAFQGPPMQSNVVTELFFSRADLKELLDAQNNLPDGAHIHSLFQIAITRIEERIDTLQRMRAGTPVQLPRLDAAA
jgi:hypothetical protein